MSQPPSARRILFVTGKLAEPALRRVVAGLDPEFQWEIAVMKITVAALMTTAWIAKFLTVPPGTELVLLPGLVEGDPEPLERRFGVKVAKGPKDLRELPRYFGRATAGADYGAWDIQILAEINNAVRLSRAELLRQAEYYRRSGADVIDIGCTPGLPFPGLAEVVSELRSRSYRVSVDSFDPAEITAAVGAGAELVLSVNGSNRPVLARLRGTGARVTVIPDFGAGLETLEPTLEACARAGVDCFIDPVIEPVGFGFMASLERYAEVRRRYPDVPQLMGIGNITELTSADSTGINALLMAIAQEVGVKAVLTTEVIPWARGSVREIDIARRLAHYAVTQGALPKQVDDRLVTTKDVQLLEYPEAELKELQAAISDPNFRIFADHERITVFNHEQFVQGTDIQAIFEQLGVDEPAHAFYLGKELMKAQLAVALGKTYRQEGQLNWGYLTPPEEPKREHFKPAMRRTRARPRGGSGRAAPKGKP